MAKNGNTKDIDRGAEKVMVNLEVTDGSSVDIGILKGEVAGVIEGAKIEVAEIAIVQEFGSTKINVPERSFLRSVTDEKREKYKAVLKSLFSKVLLGTTTVPQALDLFGERVVGDVKRKITSIRQPPNAPSTIAKKGFDNPLIRTGTLRSRIKKRVKL